MIKRFRRFLLGRQAVGSVRRNVVIVLGGNGLAALISLLTLWLNARVLGPTGVGILTLIVTFAVIVERLATFDSWQPLIKIGAEARAAEDGEKLEKVLVAAGLFDGISAILGGTVGVLGILVLGGVVGIPEQYVGVAILYVSTLFFKFSGLPVGVCRLFDYFSVPAVFQVVQALLRGAAAFILYKFGLPLVYYVVSYAGIALLSEAALLLVALGLAYRHGVCPRLYDVFRLPADILREFWSFSWVTMATSTIKVMWKNADVLLLGAMGGAGLVGVYSVAKSLAKALELAFGPLSQALYPEIARQIAMKRYGEARRLIIKVSWLGLAIGVAALLFLGIFGSWIVSFLFGVQYEAAYIPLVLLTATGAIGAMGAGLSASGFATIGPLRIFRAFVLAFLVFVVVAPSAIGWFTLVGAGTSQLVFVVVWFTVAALETARWFRRMERGEDRPAPFTSAL